MPRMDATGPFGTGPIGRGMGPCGGRRDNFGRGQGFAREGGFWGMAQAPLLSDNEKGYLEQRKGWLETQIAVISQRLQDLEKNKKEESKTELIKGFTNNTSLLEFSLILIKYLSPRVYKNNCPQVSCGRI
jgi:hypothetical protein